MPFNLHRKEPLRKIKIKRNLFDESDHPRMPLFYVVGMQL